MKKRTVFAAVLLLLAVFLILPAQENEAAVNYRIRSVDAVYQTSKYITGKATPNTTVKVKVNGKTKSAKVNKKGTFKIRIAKPKAGSKVTVTLYKGKKAKVKKVISVKTKRSFAITKFDNITNTLQGTGTQGKKIRITIGKKKYYVRVGSDGTWKKKISNPKNGTKVKAAQNLSGKKYSANKSYTIRTTAFDTSLIYQNGKYRSYYSDQKYQSGDNRDWVELAIDSISGNQAEITVGMMRVSDGDYLPLQEKGIATIIGENRMRFVYDGLVEAEFTFTWKSPQIIEANGSAEGFFENHTEILYEEP